MAIADLKKEGAQLASDIAELCSAEHELSNWRDYDRNRKDGSGAQDARHEEFGRSARDSVYFAKQKVESQKKLIIQPVNAA